MKHSIATAALALFLATPAAHCESTPLAPMPALSAPAEAGMAEQPRPALAPLDDALARALSQEGHFSLHPGQTLKEALTRWAHDAGYTLVWLAPIDLPIEAGVTFPPGTRFADAVRQTLGAFWTSRHAVTGRLYRNRVLVISGRDAA